MNRIAGLGRRIEHTLNQIAGIHINRIRREMSCPETNTRYTVNGREVFI